MLLTEKKEHKERARARRLSDHRDIFNAIISSAVKARIETDKRHLNLETYRYLLDRESVSEFLWFAFREMECGGIMIHGNIKVHKRENELYIEILSYGRKKTVLETLTLPTDFRVFEKKGLAEASPPLVC